MLKTFFKLLIFYSLVGCGTSIKGHEPSYEVALHGTNTDGETVNFYELRFYDIASARVATKAMFAKYGKSDRYNSSLHQSNMLREVWENLSLIEGDTTRYTVVTDGTETQKNFFTCIKVFDSNGQDALHPSFHSRDLLIQTLEGIIKTPEDSH